MKVVVSEFIDEAALERFGPEVELTYDPGLVDDREALFAALSGADALIVRNRTQVDRALLEAGRGLRVVGRLGVGLDNIDLDACREQGVVVHPATGANTLSVAEYVITVTLSLLRGAYASNAAMIAGDWPRNALMGQEASGRVIGARGVRRHRPRGGRAGPRHGHGDRRLRSVPVGRRSGLVGGAAL